MAVDDRASHSEDEEASALLREAGAPELLRIFDELEPTIGEAGSRTASDLMFLLKVVCMYAPPGGLEQIRRAARAPALREEYLWSVIFNVVATEGHPWQAGIVDALREPLPEGFAGIAYLDLANSGERAGHLERHPFDSEAGVCNARKLSHPKPVFDGRRV